MEENTQEIIKIHNIVLAVITITSIGVTAENIRQGWELWVFPVVLFGVLSAWWCHIAQKYTPHLRENYYFIFSIFLSFYYGAHRTSLYDIIVIVSLLLVAFTLVKRILFLRIILAEYYLLILSHIVVVWFQNELTTEYFNELRIFLHGMAVLCLYVILKRLLFKEIKDDEEILKRDSDKKQYDHEMEDFLVNISHELRTPVNVINGLSGILLKNDNREEIRSISNAGHRLARQIEDIQDYSEIQRKDLTIENEKYMITSVLNDILVSYYELERNTDLDFIVDLDPEVPSVLRGDANKIRKIIEHLLDNAFKFTVRGGVKLRITAIKKDYGINLLIEVADTGIGMTQNDIESVTGGQYKADKKRTRSTGGIGLGLSVVFGMIRNMNGFVRIESPGARGTVVRISVFQEVVDPSPCMSLNNDRFLNVLFYVVPGTYREAFMGSMYSDMAKNLAAGLRINLYSAANLDEVKKIIAKGFITHIFIGEYEYKKDQAYFDELSRNDVEVAVSARKIFDVGDSNVVIMSLPLYGYQIVQFLNGDYGDNGISVKDDFIKPDLDGVRALVVDDEPMNLVVATGILKTYNMEITTVESGKEAIEKYSENDYDVILMDHMMPEMDGIEAMKKIKAIAEDENRKVKIVAFTANAISGAKEMFLSKGFDGFISKPINIHDFERVMSQVIPDSKNVRKKGTR